MLRVFGPARALPAIPNALNQPCCLRGGVKSCFVSRHRAFAGKALPEVKTETGFKQRVQTLAIETSCDDTSVAVLAISRGHGIGRLRTKVLYHETVTANSSGYGGIHPLVALDSHQMRLGQLVERAIQRLEPKIQRQKGYEAIVQRPDFVSVTRGPGMRSNLSVGLNTAKGLALAWDVPLVGVHHMQAHALTPRLCSILDASGGTGKLVKSRPDDENEIELTEWDPKDLQPRFPFLTLLVSGGHTMLIDSNSLINHRILAESQDIAIGDYLDKAARAILKPSELKAPFGKALEDFAFHSVQQYDYDPPKRRQEELERRTTEFGWALSPPLAESKGGEKSSRRMVYSFSGLLSSVQRVAHTVLDADKVISDNAQARTITQSNAERRELAREVQRVGFEHLGSRILLHLETIARDTGTCPSVETIVLSGGVASNKFLRHVLRNMLDARGYSTIKLQFPPPELCTDNALMIAWAGMEMYDAGYESEFSIQPLRKWSMDSSADDGGIIGVGGWREREVG